MRRFTPLTWMAIALGAIVLIGLLYVFVTRDGRAGDDRLSEDQLNGQPQAPADPAAICASQRTYDELRRELFRKAAALRGRDESVFDQIARNAMLSVDRPRLVDRDGGLGQSRCAGTLVVALPPGLSAGNGQSRLRGAADYLVQAAADGSGTTVTLLTGDSLTAALATLVRSDVRPTPPQEPLDEAEPLVPPPPAIEPEPLPQPPTQEIENAAAAPSFNCRFARTVSERRVCANGGLADLDRQMAAQYVSALRSAGPGQAQALRATRDRFLAYRERCASDRCIADAYRGRMEEIGDIMSGRWNPGR